MPKPYCIIAVSPNYWGRGQTIKTALANLVKAGGKRKGAQMRFVCGDDKAFVSSMGDLIIARGSESFRLTEK